MERGLPVQFRSIGMKVVMLARVYQLILLPMLTRRIPRLPRRIRLRNLDGLAYAIGTAALSF